MALNEEKTPWFEADFSRFTGFEKYLKLSRIMINFAENFADGLILLI